MEKKLGTSEGTKTKQKGCLTGGGIRTMGNGQVISIDPGKDDILRSCMFIFLIGRNTV